MQLSVHDFISFRDYFYQRSGIYFESKKIYFVKKRLVSRFSACRVESCEDYLAKLRYRDRDGTEFQALINSLTTNETYFFREFDQLAAFGEHCLVEVVERKEENGDRGLRVWSAGCSTGEEPYTLAIIIREILEDLSFWNVKVYGTDIDTTVLQRAENGHYSKRSVKDVPDEYLAKYFTCKSGEFFVKPALKQMITLRQVNLIDRASMFRMRRMDFIFCRNVLIYFDEKSRKEVVGWFYDALMPGGYIFLGHSESLSRITTAFKVKKMGGMIVYQKPPVY